MQPVGVRANATSRRNLQHRNRFKYKDLAHQLPSGDTILIDAGKRRQSSILAVALNLIDTAKAKILMTCQFFPGGPTGKTSKWRTTAKLQD